MRCRTTASSVSTLLPRACQLVGYAPEDNAFDFFNSGVDNGARWYTEAPNRRPKVGIGDFQKITIHEDPQRNAKGGLFFVKIRVSSWIV